MSDYVLTVPEEVYARARQIAEETSQLVDEVMMEYLRTLSTPLPHIATKRRSGTRCTA